MPFERPSLAALIERASVDLAPGGVVLRRSVEYVLTRVVAGVAHGLHGHLDWLSKQLMPDTADAEHLARWARVWGLQRRAASRAVGSVVLRGNRWQQVPEGTTLQRPDGALYATTEARILHGYEVVVPVRAEQPGATYNVASGDLELTSPLQGIESRVTVVPPGIVGGVDAESDPSLRGRILERIRTPPRGGGPGDYVTWALEVPGVRKAWEYPRAFGPGSVAVLFVLDDHGDVGPIPNPETVEAVQHHIDAVRPVTADVRVAAPVPKALNLSLRLAPDTEATRQAVTEALKGMLRRVAEPGRTILLSHINEAISLAPGEMDHELLWPTQNVTHQPGEIAVLGEMVWQS